MPHKPLMHHDSIRYLFFPICKRKGFKLFQLLENKKNVLMHRPVAKDRPCLSTDNCLTTSWHWPNNFTTTAWQLPDDCLTTAWRLSEGCLMTAFDYLTTVWWLPHGCPITAGQLPYDCLRTTIQLPNIRFIEKMTLL